MIAPRFACLALGLWLVAPVLVSGQPLTRVAATSLALPAAAPTLGFTTQRTLNNLGFNQPVALASPPGETNRLFVVEKPGRILIVHNPGSAAPTTSVFLDISTPVIDSGEEGLLALAFHPDFASNGYFYVWYTLNTTTTAGSGRHDRLSRFRVSSGNANIADPNSEAPLISQRDEAANHNGGDLHFGPDGYLYLSTGDEGGGGDQFANGQRIDRDFFSAVLRLDVDQRPGSLAPNPHTGGAVHPGTYRIPPDNPFIGATTFNQAAVNPANVRTEIWATGLRNPFRFSFDSATGDLWLADVGQGSREEINRITRGGNYGWNFREGFIAYSGTPPSGVALADPVFDYPRSEGQSVTGGLVYRGTQISQLYGAYLFADYSSGRIWALRYQGTVPAAAQVLTTNAGIAGFAINPANGDILLANINEGSIRRLVYNTTQTGTPFPATLGLTGAFSDLATLSPQPGVVAYETNVDFWSDHARKRRWFALRDTSSTYLFDAHGNWTLPTSAVWMKHFDLDLTRGDSTTARRIETRFLVKTTDGVYGITYRWNEAQTEATLVPEEGTTQDFTVVENGLPRTQTWRFPSRGECRVCHTSQGGHALSFNTRQLNRDHAFPSGVANQITALAQAGYLAGNPPAPATLPTLAAADDTTRSLDLRAKSYLDANCAQCHRPGGSALGTWDARFNTPLSLAGIIDGPLTQNGGDAANRVIAPGDVARSRLLHRVAGSNGATRMPPLATNERDLAGEQLLIDWINDLAAPKPPSRLANLSGRAVVGSGDNILIPGFVLEGTAPRRMLVRAVGPTLTTFNVPGFMPEPALTLFSGETPLFANTRWNTAANADEIRTVAATLGAFALPEGSADSALLVSLNPGAYTAHIRDTAGASGIALFELYDTESGSTVRLANTSVRAQVGGGAGVIIPGLVVSEGAFKTVLIRAVGPGLAPYDVDNFLPRPVLTLYAGNEAFVSNTGWSTASNAAEIASAALAVHAFPLVGDSADSALLVTLSPGAYTLHVSSADNATGVALVEVYEVE